MRRLNEVRVGFDVVDQPWLVAFELEPIVVLHQFDDFTVAGVERAVWLPVFIRQEGFFLGRVKPFVLRFVKLSGGMQPAQDGLHDPFVSRLGRADKIVVGQVQLSGKLLPGRSHFVAVGLGALAGAEGGLLDFLPVLIHASQKKNVVAQAAVGAGDDIGNDLFVGVAEMRFTVEVVNRCRDVKPFSHALA